MANAGTNTTGTGLPIPYLTAAWAGMSQAEIVTGLANGSIFAPPEGFAANAAGLADDAKATVDRARIRGWFEALDHQMPDTTFEAIWTHAADDDATRAGVLMNSLAQTFLGSAGGGPGTPDALDAYVADPRHAASVVDLTSKTGGELAELAQGDIGYRYALAKLQPFALTGNRVLFAAVNADGEFDRFDPDTGAALVSDSWLGDRGKFLAWKGAGDSGSDMAVAGSEDWTFIDRTSMDVNGHPLKVELKSGAAGAGSNQVVFGNGEAEILKGVSGSDRMYGGGGDDVLRGGAGGDHLEGGAGDDLVMGGAGADEVVGNQGADELEGGSGNDSLAGGSGQDLLTGGRGEDRLEGGTGNDVYALESGDGTDTIVDADGLGAIELDGAPIGGTMAAVDGKWLSADGRLEFTFSGDAEEGGNLTIKAFAQGADHAGAADNTIVIKNWQSGDLGITLGGGSPGENGGPGFDFSATTGPDVPVISAEEMFDDEVAVASNGSTVAAGATAGEGALETFDYESALAALLGPDFNVPAVDAATVQQAIEAFSGVLEPPDVTAMWGDSAGVTAADVAEALAGDVGGEDFETEVGAIASPLSSGLSSLDEPRTFGSKGAADGIDK